MAINIFNNATSNNGIGRDDSTFSTGEFAVTWQQYINADRAAAFQTYMQLGGEDFPGTASYVVCFDGSGGISDSHAVGTHATDTYGTATPTVGSWVRMGYRRTINGTGWDNRFYYDLPTVASVILKNDNSGEAITLQGTSMWYFGATTWTTGEGMNGKLRAIKIFTSDIGETDLSNESATSNLVKSSLASSLYGRYPLVGDLLDASGNDRHFSTGVTLAFTGFNGSAGDYMFDGSDPFPPPSPDYQDFPINALAAPWRDHKRYS